MPFNKSVTEHPNQTQKQEMLCASVNDNWIGGVL